MSFGWIDANKYSFNTLLLFDRWIIRHISGKTPEYKHHMGIALRANPAVYWYILYKCPECAEVYRQIYENAP